MTNNPVLLLKCIARRIVYQISYSPLFKRNSMDQFNKFYYNSGVWQRTLWFGTPVWKCPLDLWVYQEIIFKIKPDVIVESGTANGGSALFLASMLDIINNGKIVTIDMQENEGRPKHKRIKYLLGSSTSKEIVEEIKGLVNAEDRILVILDSDHRKEHVLSELRIYGELVSKGSYIIVEDTNINGHPVNDDFGPGPMEAVEEFLLENKNFVVDTSKEKFYVTFNPKGYLRKIQ